jgi:hypothetical protein
VGKQGVCRTCGTKAGWAGRVDEGAGWCQGAAGLPGPRFGAVHTGFTQRRKMHRPCLNLTDAKLAPGVCLGCDLYPGTLCSQTVLIWLISEPTLWNSAARASQVCWFCSRVGTALLWVVSMPCEGCVGGAGTASYCLNMLIR